MPSPHLSETKLLHFTAKQPINQLKATISRKHQTLVVDKNITMTTKQYTNTKYHPIVFIILVTNE